MLHEHTEAQRAFEERNSRPRALPALARPGGSKLVAMSFVVRALAAGPRGRALIRGLSFSIEPGQRVALVGPSGIGKTTVLRALCLLDDPIEGELSLGGRTPDELGAVRWRRRIVMVPQRAVFFGGTVAEELARPFTYASGEGPFEPERAREMLGALELAGAWERLAAVLSEGERQRLALVRALLVAPSVLLLDEPTSALDPASIERVEALLRRSEAAIVLVSHAAAQRERMGAEAIDLGALRVADA